MYECLCVYEVLCTTLPDARITVQYLHLRSVTMAIIFRLLQFLNPVDPLIGIADCCSARGIRKAKEKTLSTVAKSDEDDGEEEERIDKALAVHSS